MKINISQWNFQNFFGYFLLFKTRKKLAISNLDEKNSKEIKF